VDELKGKMGTMEVIVNALLDYRAVNHVVKKANGREKLYKIIILILSIFLVILSALTGVKVSS